MNALQLFSEALADIPDATPRETLLIAEAALDHRDQTRSWVNDVVIAEPTLAAFDALAALPPKCSDREFIICACWILAYRRDVPALQRFASNPLRYAVAQWYWRSATFSELRDAFNRAMSKNGRGTGDPDDSGVSWAYGFKGADPAATLAELRGKPPPDTAAIELQKLVADILREREEAARGEDPQ